MNLVYNLDILPESGFRLDSNDRAFQYGDGVFETIRYENGQLWFWPDHLDRLKTGMQALHLQWPAETAESAIRPVIDQLIRINNLADRPTRIKIQVWRRPGGLYTPTTNEANLLITARLAQPFSISERTELGVYDSVRLAASPISGVKTINALPYVLAGQAKLAGGYADMVLLDQAGNLAECIASNLFWFRNGLVHTPSLQTGCIDGIARRQLLRIAPQLGLSVSAGCYPIEEAQAADLVFCANTFGVQWFQAVAGKAIAGVSRPPVEPGPFLDLLFGQFHT